MFSMIFRYATVMAMDHPRLHARFVSRRSTKPLATIFVVGYLVFWISIPAFFDKKVTYLFFSFKNLI
jgi:hypothetical protein